MSVPLSPYRLKKARDLYKTFAVSNAVSWQFLASNIITLFALRLGANATYIGLLSAIIYMSFFFLPLGKVLSGHYPLVKVYGTAWVARAIGMTPVLFVPLVYSYGRHDTAMVLILLGCGIFHVFRGIGMIGNNPVLSHLSSGPDKGSYLTQVQITNHGVGMFTGFIVAMLLGRDPPLFIYALIIAAGIGFGIFSGITMFKIPNPELEKESEKKRITDILKEALAEPAMRPFLLILPMVVLVAGVSRTFIVVYSREVFGQSDGMVALYTVFGGLGVLMSGLLVKFLVDKVGAKPMFSFCVILGLLSLIPIVAFPSSVIENYTTVTLYLIFLFFILNFGWLGSEGLMQTYYMGLVPSEKMVDMGMLYYLAFGLAGAVGSLLGGALLDATTVISGSASISFRILFGILIIVSCLTLFFMRRLTPLGALPFMGAMEIMFSPRELKAISILGKLDRSSDSDTEEALLEALQDAPSNLAIKGLLSRVKSPRLAVRIESIRAIDALRDLNEEVEKALMEDIINNPYTTAYSSARTLGNHGVFPAVPLLRELISSSDYMLAGEAMIALAKLRDDAVRPHIEAITLESQNPRLKMAGAEALGIYGDPRSLPVLLDIMTVVNPPPYLRDEIVLAMACILDIQSKFYPLLVRFLADKSLAPTLAMDESEAAYEYYAQVHARKRRSKKDPALNALGHHAKTFQGAVNDYIKNSNGSPLCRWILELPDELVHKAVQVVLSEAVLDDRLLGYPRLKLLIVSWTAHILRLWTNRLKD